MKRRPNLFQKLCVMSHLNIQEPILERNNITLNIWYTTFNFSNFLFKITYKISDNFPSSAIIISRIVILHEDIYKLPTVWTLPLGVFNSTARFSFFHQPLFIDQKEMIVKYVKMTLSFDSMKSCANFKLPPPTINKIQTVLCFVKIFDENSKFIILLQSTLVLQTSCYNVAFLRKQPTFGERKEHRN